MKNIALNTLAICLITGVDFARNQFRMAIPKIWKCKNWPKAIPTGALEMAAGGFPIAKTGRFIVGDNGVLVIEPMLNERLNRQLFDLIAAETDKPVHNLVNTSHHGDHS